jgi:hypothetical protein
MVQHQPEKGEKFTTTWRSGRKVRRAKSRTVE